MGRVGGGAKTNPPESFVTRNYLSASSFSLSKIARFGDFEEYCEPAGADSACHSECKPQPSHLDKPGGKGASIRRSFAWVQRFVSSQISNAERAGPKLAVHKRRVRKSSASADQFSAKLTQPIAWDLQMLVGTAELAVPTLLGRRVLAMLKSCTSDQTESGAWEWLGT